jgi:hypothetical protein
VTTCHASEKETIRWKKGVEGQQTRSYVGESTYGSRSNVDWICGTSKTLKVHVIVRMACAVFCVKVGRLEARAISARGTDEIPERERTDVIGIVAFLHDGIRIRSLSFRGDGLPGRRRPEFGLGRTLPVLWVVALSALGVLCEEFHSQFGHLGRIVSLVFRINVLLLELFLGERNQFRDETEMVPCVVIVEWVWRRSLVIAKGEPEESASTRRRGELDGQKEIEKIDIQGTKMVMCHGLRRLGGSKRKGEEM